MADMLTTDPFFNLTNQVAGVREKVSDSIFENYKLQVAQTNDINNRAMQVALHDSSELANIKQEIANSTLQTMLAAARTDAAIGATSAAQQRLVMEQAEATRRLIVDLNTQNLNTALINTNTALTGLGVQFGGLGLAYGGAVSAYQSANQVSAVNALQSAISSQGLVNTGTMTGTTQTSTPTSIT
jgi:DNA uptake protein ComE-like DNA-binding protein